MGDSLDPPVIARLLAVLRPDWSRTVAARRVAAGALVVLAAAAALRADPDGQRSDIVVAARDLRPGAPLTAEDVRLESRSAATVPDGSQADLTAVIGATLAGPARRGEVLTDVRLVGSRLAQAAAGPDARLVPVHLSDSALLDMLRPGDVVDVLAAATSDPAEARPRVIATDAVVVLVSEKPKATATSGERVVLLALPARVADDVATAALVQTVTVTLH